MVTGTGTAAKFRRQINGILKLKSVDRIGHRLKPLSFRQAASSGKALQKLWKR